MDHLDVQNLKHVSLSAFDEKFLNIFHEVVCNLHHKSEPLVAYIRFK